MCVGRNPLTTKIRIRCLSTILEIWRACYISTFTRMHLLHSHFPAFMNLKVSKSEYFWLTSVSYSWIFHYLSSVMVISFPMNTDPIAHLTCYFRISWCSDFNRYIRNFFHPYRILMSNMIKSVVPINSNYFIFTWFSSWLWMTLRFISIFKNFLCFFFETFILHFAVSFKYMRIWFTAKFCCMEFSTTSRNIT